MTGLHFYSFMATKKILASTFLVSSLALSPPAVCLCHGPQMLLLLQQ
jgi:hypothetical protein